MVDFQPKELEGVEADNKPVEAVNEEKKDENIPVMSSKKDNKTSKKKEKEKREKAKKEKKLKDKKGTQKY